MKKSKVIISMLIMLLILIFPLTIDAAQINPDDYQASGPTASDVKDMYKFGGSIAGVVQIAGTIVSVGVMMLLGVRYMLASADEKAEYRERMLPYFIGAILLFGASNIVNIVYKMFDSTGKMKDSDQITSTFTVANFEFNNCHDCGKAITQEEQDNDRCSCGSLIMFADINSTHCGYCGTDNVVLVIVEGKIFKNSVKGSNTTMDLYCYNCDLWNNYTAKAEREMKLADATDEAKSIVEENR